MIVPNNVRESDYVTQIIPEILSDESAIYVASHPQLKGCIAQGKTPEEASENLSEVFQSYIEHFAEFGLQVPEPQTSIIDSVVWRSVVTRQKPVSSPPLPSASYSKLGPNSLAITEFNISPSGTIVKKSA